LTCLSGRVDDRMKTRYRLIRRGVRNGVFYSVDTKTGKRTSLLTGREDEASQIIHAKNQALRQLVLNMQIAKAYLYGTDNAIHPRLKPCDRPYGHQNRHRLRIREKQGMRAKKAPKHPRCQRKIEGEPKKLCQSVEQAENHKKGPRWSWAGNHMGNVNQYE